jgi:hypothetical protein
MQTQTHVQIPGTDRWRLEMRQTSNGMPAGQLPAVTWLKSRRSNPSGNCVEMARLPEGEVAVRNSRDPDGPVLVCTTREIAAFIDAVRSGEFDNLLA